MKNILRAFLVSASFLIPASFACDQASCPAAGGHACAHGCGGHGPKVRGMADHGTYYLDFADELGLTQDQIARLNRIRTDAQKAAAKIEADMGEAEGRLHEASHGASPDKKAIDKAAKKIGELKGKAIAARAASLVDARAVLTPEQQKKIADAHAGIAPEKPQGPSCH